MKVTLIVLGCLLALILLLLALRVGILAEYSEHGVLVRVRAGPVRITLIPKRKKKKARKEKKEKKSRKTRKEKRKKEDKKTERKTKKKRGGSLKKLLELLPMLFRTLGDLCRRIRIDHLRVHYTIAGQPEPDKAALLYGRLQFGGGAVCRLLEEHMQVRKREVSVEVNFFTEQATVYASAACSLRIGQVLAAALRLLWTYWKWNRQNKQTAREERTDG